MPKQGSARVLRKLNLSPRAQKQHQQHTEMQPLNLVYIYIYIAQLTLPLCSEHTIQDDPSARPETGVFLQTVLDTQQMVGHPPPTLDAGYRILDVGR